MQLEHTEEQDGKYHPQSSVRTAQGPKRSDRKQGPVITNGLDVEDDKE